MTKDNENTEHRSFSLCASQRAISCEYDFTAPGGEHFEAISTTGPGSEMPLVVVMLRGSEGNYCARAYVGVQLIAESIAGKTFTASMQLSRLVAPWRSEWYQNYSQGDMASPAGVAA